MTRICAVSERYAFHGLHEQLAAAHAESPTGLAALLAKIDDVDCLAGCLHDDLGIAQRCAEQIGGDVATKMPELLGRPRLSANDILDMMAMAFAAPRLALAVENAVRHAALYDPDENRISSHLSRVRGIKAARFL